MKPQISFLSFLLLFVWIGNNNNNAVSGEIIKRSEYLDTANRYHAEWEINFDSEMATFWVTVQGTGYVGLGISPGPNMAGADIVIGGVNDDGTTYFGDYHATQNGYPIQDAHADWQLLNATERDGFTYLSFERKLNTCDEQDVAISNDTQHLIWAIGQTDRIEKHENENRGPKSVYLLDPPTPPVDTSEFEVWRPSFTMTMPSAHTTYWCTIHKAPDFKGVKHHVVGFNTILDSDLSLKHVHHLVLSKCSPPEGTTGEEFFEPFIGHEGGECYADNPTIPSDYCRSILYIWAVGGQPLFLPAEAGYGIGGNTTEREYIMLEIHYDNPAEEANLTFETSVEVYYTPNLRTYDASVFILGHSVGPYQTIPPKVTDFVTVAHCSPQCTNQMLPTEGFLLFNAMLHAHTVGKALRVRHFRDGKELPWLITDDHYDFNYQANRPYRENKLFLPGDQLTLECTYDTSKRENVTIGGFPSSYEMCQAFFWHYPSDRFMNCAGEANLNLTQLFGIQNFTWTFHPKDEIIVTEPEELKGMKYTTVLNEVVNWTDELVGKLQEVSRYHDQVASCGVDGSDENGSRHFINYPAIDEEWTMPNPCLA